MPWRSYAVKEQIKIEKLYSLFKRHYEQGYNFAGEMHDFWEAVYVIDGEVIISADENVHNFKSGCKKEYIINAVTIKHSRLMILVLFKNSFSIDAMAYIKHLPTFNRQELLFLFISESCDELIELLHRGF